MKALQKNVIFNRVGFDKIGNFEYEKIMVLEAAWLFVRPSGMSFEAFRRAAAQSKYGAKHFPSQRKLALKKPKN